MTDKVRLGFIGAGWWATANHMPVLAAREDVEMAAVCRLGRRELEAVRDRFGFRFATEDYQELLEQPLDAVVVASPHSLHHTHAKAALERGLHVMVEKPMTLRATEAWELVVLARARDRHLLVPYGWNYKPFVEEAQRRLADGAVGAIEYVMCHMASPIRGLLVGRDVADVAGYGGLFAPDARTWADPRVAGGGYGLAQMTHSTGLLFYVAPLRAARAFAEMSAPDSAVELYDAISIRFRNGAVGVVSGAGTVPAPSGFQLDVRIFGSEGMLLLDVERERLEVRRRDGRAFTMPLHSGDGAYTCVTPPNRFVDLIRGLSDRNNSSGEIAARSVELLDAAYRSAVSGCPEAVE
ncbi:MAG: Gfo/Idh/MocA family oxidoreductase [Chloroflexi bacterium]|nr:Gfo/Idh/MocA family oxidoreductase [Chloroflexota bacterium]